MLCRSTKNVLLVISLLALTVSCNSQQNDAKDNKKEVTDDLMSQELQNQENAKSGNKNPRVEIINDPQKAGQLRKIIIKKIQEKEKLDTEAAKNKALWQRYKENDKSVVPALLNILRGNEAGTRAKVYKGLQKKYEDSESYIIREPELAEQLLKGIDNPEDEKDVVQLAGMNKLPGYQRIFESRLLSGKSTDEGRIFYWLGYEAKSVKALDYMQSRVKAMKLSEKELGQVMDGLENYGRNGDDEMKKKVGGLALFIYQHKLIKEERFEDLRNSAFTSDAAETLLACLFEYGDERVIIIANDILKRGIRVVGPVKALIRLEGLQHINKVYACLRDENTFYTGLDLVESIDRRLVPDDLLKEVLLEFAKRKNIKDYETERLVKLFIDLHAESYLKNAGKLITDKQLLNRISKLYQVHKISFEEVLNDLIRLKIIEKRPDQTDIARISKEAKADPRAFIFGVLDQQKLYYSFDAETDFIPVDYDKLLPGFAAKSKAVLKDMLVGMDVEENKDKGTFQYVITVVSNNTAFIAKPQDMGDWYDIQAVNVLLQKVLDNLDRSEKFVPVEAGGQTVQYIFGDPEKINEFVKKYNL